MTCMLDFFFIFKMYHKRMDCVLFTWAMVILCLILHNKRVIFWKTTDAVLYYSWMMYTRVKTCCKIIQEIQMRTVLKSPNCIYQLISFDNMVFFQSYCSEIHFLEYFYSVTSWPCTAVSHTAVNWWWIVLISCVKLIIKNLMFYFHFSKFDTLTYVYFLGNCYINKISIEIKS